MRTDNGVRPNETTNQALERCGFYRSSHHPDDDICAELRIASGFHKGACLGKHIVRPRDGAVVWSLGCSPSAKMANDWIAMGCPMEES